jgi:DNA-binding ferritin-like protein (Dps family)
MVSELTGADVAAFCDTLLRAHAVDEATWRKSQNQTILDSISKKTNLLNRIKR